MAKAVKPTARRAVKRLAPTQAVRIDKNGLVVPNDRIVKVRKKLNENVLWIATGGGGPWWVTFDKPDADPSGSPFNRNFYKVDKGGSHGSSDGPVNGRPGLRYQYNVRKASASGPITDDPDVDIE